MVKGSKRGVPMSTLACARTVALFGIGVRPALVEVHIGRGLPGAQLVGLPDTAIREARDRVRAAFDSSGLSWPRGKITVNLAPADLHKQGTTFDLPIAAAIAVASGVVPQNSLERCVLVGELGLDGSVRKSRSILPAAIFCRKNGVRLIGPRQNSWEARLVEGCEFAGISTLAELVAYMRGELSTEHASSFTPGECVDQTHCSSSPDVELSRCPQRGQSDDDTELADALKGLVLGATQARALEAIAAAAVGGMNVLLWGRPGCGKTILGRLAVGLLPDLDTEAAIEVRVIHSMVQSEEEIGLPRRPPFRAPHHSVSPAALVGGGSGIPKPGEVSLAHRGVLFLDELALFPGPSLEALRQPLEDGVVRISRSLATVEYPARPIVVAATNVCRCGGPGDVTTLGSRLSVGVHDSEGLPQTATISEPSSKFSSQLQDREVRCRCSPVDRAKFLKRLSAPLIDRFDLCVRLEPPNSSELLEARTDRSLIWWREKVAEGRELVRSILGSEKTLAECTPREMSTLLAPEREARSLLDRWASLQRASARRVHKTVRVMWSLAALDGREKPDSEHLERAIAMIELPPGLGP
jgi:magnesium chelatase family protein